MLITIEKVLTPEQVNEARQKLATAEWVDGRVTAGYQAQEVKRNAQIPENSPVAKELGDMILAGLARSPRFMSAALPLRVFPPMFNSYAGGQTFGTHVDTAIRQLATTGQRIRTDLSATVFLTPPSDYDGGELIVDTLCPDRTRASIAVVAALLILFSTASAVQIAAIALGGVAGFWLCRGGPPVSTGHMTMPVSRPVGLVALAAFFLLLGGLPLLHSLTGSQGVALFDAFYQSGALVFGGGHVVLPLLHQAVVAPG